ncbi:hypothetical protein L1281_001491 [Neisseria sp. HSC-16F19]|nr:hypothetical protein [Neisseria sp. HSC-16F19]
MAAFVKVRTNGTAAAPVWHAQHRQKQDLFLHILLLYARINLIFGALWRSRVAKKMRCTAARLVLAAARRLGDNRACCRRDGRRVRPALFRPHRRRRHP